MPSLTVPFSDDEYRQILGAALRRNIPVEQFVLEAALTAAGDSRGVVSDLADRIAKKSAELNKRLK